MNKEMRLALACFRLGVSYDKGRRMLFTGELTGRQENGRWLVNVESVEKALQKLEPHMAAATG